MTIRALPIVMPVNYSYLGGSVVLGMNDGPARRSITGDSVVALGSTAATSTKASGRCS